MMLLLAALLAYGGIRDAALACRELATATKLELSCGSESAVLLDWWGDGRVVLAALTNPGPSRRAEVVVAVLTEGASWRLSRQGMSDWETSPVKLAAAPRGRHERVPPYTRPLEPAEVDSAETPGEGIVVTYSDGRRRLFFPGAHSTKWVYLGFAGRQAE